MSSSNELIHSQEYLSFRSSIPLRRISVDSDASKGWKIYDSGPKSVKVPIICLPPASGTADVFFKQVLALNAKGFRVIAAEPPAYWTVKEFCEGLKKLIDHLGLLKIHIFGASLGGFLAQKFAEYTSNCSRVASLILCNSFTDTSIFNYADTASYFWMLPSLVLKRMVMGNFSNKIVDSKIADSIDFMVDRLESLTQPELASRLTLNCLECAVQPQKLSGLKITLIDVFDEYALSTQVRENLYKSYPSAKLAHLKSGGNFPYLSRCDEVNLHIQIHLRSFEDTNLWAAEPLNNTEKSH
ncbi:maspardin-like [Neocloeon triangulifer]|uniref:maspardin-like n=1 Tax=Neocloeon triangulifer TaxID=2078957 RepID=UPI00286FAD3D|nr:maspardin-like [Neocloeon triangulifer]